MLKNLLTFENMVTPKIINIIYWIGLLSVIITGLFTMSGGPYSPMTFQTFIVGLISIALGALFTRIFCEMIIVVFNIYSKLKEINENLKIKSNYYFIPTDVLFTKTSIIFTYHYK